ncbi:hypothetical protein FGU65_01000 [Methanoculleus sp. FWC-SCC1]|uniref:Uncharacterized protein n=1 Tax=Methanoculleus frigidifontis TaxID=2584085 RepID=A0ABT8M6C6_9EURY|nr:hypothetical protein [Methanoculleus sp. FWC-SCC1]MDN7023490.1 hypothetical protein [Methanoculleus sp. FWC-SCC1]
MTLERLLLVFFALVVLFQLFMMYVMYRRIKQQQDELDQLGQNLEFSNQDLEMLISATKNINFR